MVNILDKTKEATTIKTKKMYVSVPINRIREVEEKLNKIFEEELHSAGSILVSYKKEVVSKGNFWCNLYSCSCSCSSINSTILFSWSYWVRYCHCDCRYCNITNWCINWK